MPSMANLTVKKNDGTTDIVYSVQTPSAGESVPAIWRQDTGNTAPPGHRPVFQVWTQWNGPKTARQVKFTYGYPHSYLDSSSQYQSKDKVVASGTIVVPQGIAQTSIDEAVSQFLNLMATTLMKDTGKTGYAPT